MKKVPEVEWMVLEVIRVHWKPRRTIKGNMRRWKQGYLFLAGKFSKLNRPEVTLIFPTLSIIIEIGSMFLIQIKVLTNLYNASISKQIIGI